MSIDDILIEAASDLGWVVKWTQFYSPMTDMFDITFYFSESGKAAFSLPLELIEAGSPQEVYAEVMKRAEAAKSESLEFMEDKGWLNEG